jgi:hypothetical protein
MTAVYLLMIGGVAFAAAMLAIGTAVAAALLDAWIDR